MNKKVFWWIGFLVAAAISCWATSTSFHFLMPAWPIWAVWAFTILCFVFASVSVKLVWDALDNDGSLSHPKLQLWGGLLLLLLTWVIISLPTNAHTFFYYLQIGDVVTEDLKTTKTYSQQLANRTVVDSAYYAKESAAMEEWKLFVDEVKAGIETGRTGLGKMAVSHITEINKILTPKYQMTIPPNTHLAHDKELTQLVNILKDELARKLEELKSEEYQVKEEAVSAAKKDIVKIEAVEDSVHQAIQTNKIAEDIVTQSSGVLKTAYSNIKNNEKYVKFNNQDEKVLYTAANLETKTTRFLSPYAVTWDFFTGKIPLSFTLWLIISMVIDIIGFFCYYQANKKKYNF